MERASFYQGQTDAFLANLNVRICGNDYTATTAHDIRNLFAPPNPPSNPDPRPVFVAINCLTNSPSHAYHQVLLNEPYAGGGAQDFSARIAAWRAIIDTVEAPPPLLSGAHLANGVFEFTIPGQRGRTNRVEFSPGTFNWMTLTNITGTNGPVLARDADLGADRARIYRVVRP